MEGGRYDWKASGLKSWKEGLPSVEMVKTVRGWYLEDQVRSSTLKKLSSGGVEQQATNIHLSSSDLLRTFKFGSCWHMEII